MQPFIRFGDFGGKCSAMVFGACLICLGWASPLQAGVVAIYDLKTGPGAPPQTEAFYYEQARFRGEGILIKGQQIIAYEDGARAFWEPKSKESYCHGLLAVQMAVQLMMPPELLKPINRRKVTRKELGSKTIGGFKAVGYQFFVDGEPAGNVWVSDDQKLADLSNLQESFEAITRCDLPDNLKTDLTDSRVYRETVKGRVVLEDDEKRLSRIETRDIPDKVFEMPEGYRKFVDGDLFMRYVSAHMEPGSGGSSE